MGAYEPLEFRRPLQLARHRGVPVLAVDDVSVSKTGMFLLASAGLVELDKLLPGGPTEFWHYMLLTLGGMFLARLWDRKP
jgi:hypothetical protein